jgi:hypothetical protein
MGSRERAVPAAHRSFSARRIPAVRRCSCMAPAARRTSDTWPGARGRVPSLCPLRPLTGADAVLAGVTRGHGRPLPQAYDAPPSAGTTSRSSARRDSGIYVTLERPVARLAALAPAHALRAPSPALSSASRPRLTEQRRGDLALAAQRATRHPRDVATSGGHSCPLLVLHCATTIVCPSGCARPRGACGPSERLVVLGDRATCCPSRRIRRACSSHEVPERRRWNGRIGMTDADFEGRVAAATAARAGVAPAARSRFTARWGGFATTRLREMPHSTSRNSLRAPQGVDVSSLASAEEASASRDASRSRS